MSAFSVAVGITTGIAAGIVVIGVGVLAVGAGVGAAGLGYAYSVSEPAEPPRPLTEADKIARENHDAKAIAMRHHNNEKLCEEYAMPRNVPFEQWADRKPDPAKLVECWAKLGDAF